MSFLKQIDLGESFAPFEFFRNNFGFVPNLFSAQSLLPRALQVETELTDILLVRESALLARQRQLILLSVGVARQNAYCINLHWAALESLGLNEQQLRKIVADYRLAGLSAADVALLDFSFKLSLYPLWICREDIQSLRQKGLTDEQILEAELIISYGVFACTLATGLGVAPDFKRWSVESPTYSFSPDIGKVSDSSGPYLRAVEPDPDGFWPFSFFQARLGFVPSFFRAQTLRPDVVESEARALEVVLLTEDVLARRQKEFIFLVISAANLNTYCVANHCGLLRGLGMPEDESDQIAFDRHNAGLSPENVALLDFALRLTQHPAQFCRQEIETLRRHNFTDTQILEAVVLSGFVNFVNTLNEALGVRPDFEPKHVFKPGHLAERHNLKALGEISATGLNLSPAPDSLIDEDARLVAGVRDGDLNAFEDLVRRHHGRVYRTLAGITGNADEAEDYTQNVFLKAFKNLGKFEGAAKFSTWLTRIAINEAIERMRNQRPLESLDDGGAIESEDYRPHQLQAWVDDPEQLYSRKEMREIVEREMMKLPSKYRIAVMLRDIEQLSNHEAAASMNLGIGAFKSRLLRGRLALREALAPWFRETTKGVSRV